MTGAESLLYDDPAFFARYRQMRDRRAGLNEDLAAGRPYAAAMRARLEAFVLRNLCGRARRSSTAGYRVGIYTLDSQAAGPTATR
jgi:hypothetical protein